MVTGLGAGHIPGFAGVKGRDHVQIVARTDVVGRERVAAVRLPLGFGGAFGVQPCP